MKRERRGYYLLRNACALNLQACVPRLVLPESHRRFCKLRIDRVVVPEPVHNGPVRVMAIETRELESQNRGSAFVFDRLLSARLTGRAALGGPVQEVLGCSEMLQRQTKSRRSWR